MPLFLHSFPTLSPLFLQDEAEDAKGAAEEEAAYTDGRRRKDEELRCVLAVIRHGGETGEMWYAGCHQARRWDGRGDARTHPP